MPTDFLKQRRVTGKAEIQPAVLLAEGHRAPAELKHAVPHIRMITERAALIAQRSLHGHRRTCSEKVTGTVLQLQLIFVVYQAHGASLTWLPADQARAWQ